MRRQEERIQNNKPPIVDLCISKLKEEDFAHRGFLCPTQIALKTYKTQKSQPQNMLTPNSLPGGLKLAIKENIANNRYTLVNIEGINYALYKNRKQEILFQSFKSLKHNNKDNLLSLMKPLKRVQQNEILQTLKIQFQKKDKNDLSGNNISTYLTKMKQRQILQQQSGLQLAICICMYSEDKKMLKSTLSGVAKNISTLVSKGRVNPDKIGVFVMMDGIQKVNKEVVDYFQQLQRSSNINLGQNLVDALSPQQLKQRQQKYSAKQIQQMQLKNVNNFLFNAAELTNRNQRRFKSVYDQYMQIGNLLKQIQKLKKQTPNFQKLPSKLKPFFIQQMFEAYYKDMGYSKDEIQKLMKQKDGKKLIQQRLIQQYTQDNKKVKPLIMKTLQKGENYCKDYISTREDLAYLVGFRQKIRFTHQDILGSKLKQQRQQNNNHSRNSIPRSDQSLYLEQEMQQVMTYMNLFLCVKYKNAGKLSSHNWFFNGFCKELQPKYAILLDVGLKPKAGALYKMYKQMVNDKTLGGVCGYMSLKIQKLQDEDQIKEDDQIDCISQLSLKFVDIQRTQQVEYHFAHLMDKCFQASFGFIHVLPGAFSGYNMKAIVDYPQKGGKGQINDQQRLAERDKRQKSDQLLKAYFKSIDDKIANQKVIQQKIGYGNLFLRVLLPDFINKCFIKIDPDSDQAMLYNQNVYLAQDRILCMGIHKKGFDMKFLPDAYAEVDPIKTVHGLLGQRKRWINGSFFAFQKVKKQLAEHEIQKDNTEICLKIQLFYLTLMNALAYFAPSLFLFTVHIAMHAFRSDVLPHILSGFVTESTNSNFYNFFVYTMDFIYVMLIMSIVFFSLHLKNGDKKFKPFIYTVSTFLGFFSISVFAVFVVDIIRGFIDDSGFLIANKALIEQLPSGQAIITAFRWILVSTTLVYIIPIFFYIALFRKFSVLWQIIMGAFSFIFYTPTYLNILNIYSLCRIDDISWGTKGLDSSSNKNSNLKDGWKLIKFIHVSKYIIWNIILGVILLSFGNSYLSRFYITLGFVIIMAASLGIKILVSIVYMVHYKITSFCAQNSDQLNDLTDYSTVKSMIELYKAPITEQIKKFLTEEEQQRNKPQNKNLTLVQIMKTTASKIKFSQKFKKEVNQRSSIQKKNPKTDQIRQNRKQQQMPSIPEGNQEEEQRFITNKKPQKKIEESSMHSNSPMQKMSQQQEERTQPIPLVGRKVQLPPINSNPGNLAPGSVISSGLPKQPKKWARK